MRRHQAGALAYYTFDALTAYPELVHGVMTRHGGASAAPYATLNLTMGDGDAQAAVEKNLRLACAALGLRREHLVSLNQGHTANVRRARRADRGRVFSGYDALVTDDAGVPLLLRFADCTPIIIYDPVRRALAAVHSGWRGAVLGAARAAVAMLSAACGSRPADMVAAIGPCIGPCCYEVGEDVVTAVGRTFGRSEHLLPRQEDGRRHFDLWAANERWLREAGVGAVEIAGICTACHTDEFYSHRAEAGLTGRFGMLAALSETA